jgi:hypothetical protein
VLPSQKQMKKKKKKIFNYEIVKKLDDIIKHTKSLFTIDIKKFLDENNFEIYEEEAKMASIGNFIFSR